MVKNAKQNWINLGYELFAKEGIEGIHVERLGRILKLNKSGFYHYFKTPDNFLQVLFDHHRSLANEMAQEIEGCERLDPDYFKVVLKFKLFVLAQGQFARRRNDSTFGTVLNEVREITNKPLLPLWRKTFNLPDDLELVLQHFSLFRNAFNAQANFDTLTHSFLHDMLEENLNMMRQVFKHQHLQIRKINQPEKVNSVLNKSVKG